MGTVPSTPDTGYGVHIPLSITTDRKPQNLKTDHALTKSVGCSGQQKPVFSAAPTTEMIRRSEVVCLPSLYP